MTWLVTLVLTSLTVTWLTEARIGFKKQLEMDTEFPAMIRRETGFPTGHLRPLGHHRAPESPVDELKVIPDIRILRQGYTKQKTPVVFRNTLKDEDVFRDWNTDKYLKDTFGKMNVTVITQRPILYRDEVKRTTQQMKVKKFLQEYEYEDWYISSVIPDAIQEHLLLPSLFNCGVLSRYLARPELWMSSGSTASKLHSHYDHNLHCVLFGRRDYALVENRYKSNFEYKETYPNSGEGYSNIDMESINLYKHKRVSDTPWYWATLRQGDCILVPSGYLHYVHAYGRSISYNILFSPASDVDEDVFKPTCKKTDKVKKMSEANFLWAYENGKLRLRNSNMDKEAVSHALQFILGSNDEIYYERFQHFFNVSMSTMEKYPEADEVFEILKENIEDPSSRKNRGRGLNYVTRGDVKALKDDQLERLAEIFNNPGRYVDRKGHMEHEEL